MYLIQRLLLILFITSLLTACSPKEKNFTSYHFSTLATPDPIDAAFNAVNPEKTEKNVQGIIIPHHLLAADLIAEALETAKSSEVKTILLISPNHFFRGSSEILTSSYDWKTPYGIFENNRVLLSKLMIPLDEKTLENEHGINNVTPFLKKVFPQAKFLPLIIKETMKSNDLKNLAVELKNALPKNTIIVGSFDFSHELPKRAAELQDEMSLTVLNNLETESTQRLDIDSRAGLELFLELMKLMKAEKWTFLNHKNSVDYTKKAEKQETTSYITGYYAAGEKNMERKGTLKIFGDLMLGRMVKKAMKEQGNEYPFKKIPRFFSGTDLTIANLEGTFTSLPSLPENDLRAIFRFDPGVLPILKKLGFTSFGLANNHLLDSTIKGFEETKQYLNEAGLEFFGDPMNLSGISKIATIREMKIALVGFHAFKMGYKNILTEIKNLENTVDYTLVFPHWGVEMSQAFSKTQQQLAHEMIDAGADIILGAHPHVIQPLEVYNNKLIFYSLGNFLFDQNFSRATEEGLGVGLVIESSTLKVSLFPLSIKNAQIDFLSLKRSDIILQDLASRSLVPQSIKNQILQGSFILKSSSL